ncbi:hypothetical protein DLM45_09830 [Hyphomicrobium methylovorum]|uniref:hypothetical protein n=1 Tax=Hyphomicrobium methylovorum TaxID=84 RepID=UPI0015E66E6F|nr:hypothetical protein [Hyphomicrobium methylovorum]MBA2126518.1 hypothetical protein [Hyphomicrobium methylovorum]
MYRYLILASGALLLATPTFADTTDSTVKSSDQETGQAESSKTAKPASSEGAGSHGPTGSKSGPAVKPEEKKANPSDQ